MVREAPEKEIVQIWVSERFADKNQTLLRRFPDRIPVEILSDSVFAHVSDTKTPQGVLCVLRQKSYDLAQIIQTEKPLLLLLDGLQDPGNLGTILRTGEAAGVTGMILSKDCVDIYNPKVIRSTMGSVYRMPFIYVEDLAKTAIWIKGKGIHIYAAHLQGKNAYDKEGYQNGTAFLIGNEGNGLRKEVAEQADVKIQIPMQGQVESLNAAAAATILMYEAMRQRREELEW